MTAPFLPGGLFDVRPGQLACVVTSLQMLRRPDVAPLHRDDVGLWPVPAPRPDRYRALFRRVGEDWLWWSRLRLTDEALARVTGDADVEVYAVSRDGVDHGLLELDFRVADSCELAFMGVTQALRRQGVGRWLMARAIERAWARPIRRFWVHTCTLDHPAALPLYLRHGFVPFRRQVEIADDPRRLGLYPPEAAPDIPLL